MLIFIFSIIFSNFTYSSCVKDFPNKNYKIKNVDTKIISFEKEISDQRYTMNPLNLFGIHNHFQGVYIDKKATYLTGGNSKNNSAKLFIIDEASNVRSILLNDNKKYWHAGSFQKHDNNLIIPIETLTEPYSSQIVSFNLESEKVKVLYNKKTNKTGAIDIITYNNEEMIFLFDPVEISIYKYPEFQFIKSIKRHIFTGSSAKIIKNCKNEFFIVNITNNGLFPPIINNKNILEVYKLNMQTFKTKKLTNIEVKCIECNLRGAANIQILNNDFFVSSSSMYLSLFNKSLHVELIRDSK